MFGLGLHITRGSVSPFLTVLKQETRPATVAPLIKDLDLATDHLACTGCYDLIHVFNSFLASFILLCCRGDGLCPLDMMITLTTDAYQIFTAAIIGDFHLFAMTDNDGIGKKKSSLLPLPLLANQPLPEPVKTLLSKGPSLLYTQGLT